MTPTITSLENWADEVSRLQEQKTLLENQIAQIVQENDRLRADYRALMTGSCLEAAVLEVEERGRQIGEMALKIKALEGYLDDTLADLKQAMQFEDRANMRRSDRSKAMVAYSKDVANWQLILKTAAWAFKAAAEYDSPEYVRSEVLAELIAEFERRCQEYEMQGSGDIAPVGYSDIPF